MKSCVKWCRLGLLAVVAVTTLSCNVFQKSGDSWRELNSVTVSKHSLTTRHRTIPETDVPLWTIPGKVYDSVDLPEIQLADGVKATIAWGAGAALEQLLKGVVLLLELRH